MEEQIKNVLLSLFQGKIYHMRAPQGYPIPFCTFQQVGGVPLNTFCGNADKNARIKFWVWADNSQQAISLMRQASALLTEPPLRAVSLGGAMAMDDPITLRKGATQDFSFWGNFT